MRNVETGVLVWGDRYMPASVVVDQAKAIHASGVADWLVMSDQLMNFIPPQLWNPEVTPMAEVLPDPDSLADPWTLISYAAAAVPGLGLSVLTDSVRHGPAQLVHMMATLAAITEGKALFQIGAGEVKNINPFGWKRSQGLSRMEDLYRVLDAFWDTDGPVTFEGNRWTLKNAYMGGAKQYKPEIMGLGGGPKLLDMATTYASGFSAAAPCVWATPEECADHVQRLRADLERKGRDPDAYRYGILCPVLIHEDEQAMQEALANPLVRWIAAVFGRINPEDWRTSGLEPAVPEGWTYYMKMRPYDTTDAFVDEVLSKATPQHAEQGYIWGTPQQVADRLGEYVDAGVNWVGPVDYMPLVRDPEDAAKSLGRTLEVCRPLKQR